MPQCWTDFNRSFKHDELNQKWIRGCLSPVRFELWEVDFNPNKSPGGLIQGGLEWPTPSPDQRQGQSVADPGTNATLQSSWKIAVALMRGDPVHLKWSSGPALPSGTLQWSSSLLPGLRKSSAGPTISAWVSSTSSTTWALRRGVAIAWEVNFRQIRNCKQSAVPQYKPYSQRALM